MWQCDALNALICCTPSAIMTRGIAPFALKESGIIVVTLVTSASCSRRYMHYPIIFVTLITRLSSAINACLAQWKAAATFKINRIVIISYF